MNAFRLGLVVAGLNLLGGAALAQGGPGMGPGMVPGAAASGARPGPGMQGHRGPGAQAGSDFTPGWSLMTPEERTAHRARMLSMKTPEDCKAYRDQHHEAMAARAKEKGGKPLAAARRDACAGLKR